MKFITDEFVKIKKIDYLGEDFEFGNNYCIVDIHLENDERVLTNVLHRNRERHAICHVKRVQYSGDIKG